jgi:hypothetical protein
MAKSLKIQNQELRAQLEALTLKLRGQIAQANRYFERLKLLEIENRELIALLKEHGVDRNPTLTTVQSLRDRCIELSRELGMANVRIKSGAIEVRQNGDWAVI